MRILFLLAVVLASASAQAAWRACDFTILEYGSVEFAGPKVTSFSGVAFQEVPDTRTVTDIKNFCSDQAQRFVVDECRDRSFLKNMLHPGSVRINYVAKLNKGSVFSTATGSRSTSLCSLYR